MATGQRVFESADRPEQATMTLITSSHLVGGSRRRAPRLLQLHELRNEALDCRLWRWFGNATGALVVLYLFLDRGGAHLHVPHLPGYLGEFILALGLLASMVGTRWVLAAATIDNTVGILLGFMAYCVLRTVPHIQRFGITTTLHDAALWYYGAFSVLLIAAFLATPELVARMVRAFSRVVPWLSLWLPFAILIDRSSHRTLLHFKYSNVPLLTHKPGNVCVAAALCLAWVWLVPDPRRGWRMRAALTALSLLTIALGATQTRGGGLAALVATVLTVVFMGARRSRVLIGVLGVTLVVLGVGAATNVTYHTPKRTISVAQLLTNAQSLEGGSTTKLSGSVAFRISLWSTILDKQVTTSHLITGFGFGPNLATVGGLNPRPDQSQQLQLRSAHNSWLDIFARTGIIGSFLWLLLWVAWFRKLGLARRRCRREGDEWGLGVIGASMVGVVAIFIDCFFDPGLEGPQLDIPLFILLAVGLFCALRPFAAAPRPPTTELPTSESPGAPDRPSWHRGPAVGSAPRTVGGSAAAGSAPAT